MARAACVAVFFLGLALGIPPARAKALGTKPQVVQRVAPTYPEAARRKGIAGRVVVRVQLDAEGKIVGSAIRQSPDELLSEAVEEAVAKWEFRPALKDGKPVAAFADYEFVFNLKDAEGAQTQPRPEPPDEPTVARYVTAKSGSEAFRNSYWQAPDHKSFASAESGAWGWVANRASAERAEQDALEECDRHRKQPTHPCRTVDVDGRWRKEAERTATPVNRLLPFEIAMHRREKVESWSAEKKAKALPLLDQCRAEADRFVEVWKSQEIDVIYAEVAQEMRDDYPKAQFDQSVAAMRQLAGVPTRVTFRDQFLMTRWGDDALRLDLHSVVTYSASTTTRKGPGVIFLIQLSMEGANCRVTGFQYWAAGMGPAPYQLEGAEHGI